MQVLTINKKNSLKKNYFFRLFHRINKEPSKIIIVLVVFQKCCLNFSLFFQLPEKRLSQSNLHKL